MSTRVHLRFVGAGLWDGSDDYPYLDSPFPRIPVVGDGLILPDDGKLWTVTAVTFRFEGGLSNAPVVMVVLHA